MSDTRIREDQIAKIRQLPEQLEALVSGLPREELTARPLAGEWSVAQNVHHLIEHRGTCRHGT